MYIYTYIHTYIYIYIYICIWALSYPPPLIFDRRAAQAVLA